MKTVSSLVQETVDFTDRGLFEIAFVYVCAAVAETVKKVFEKENLNELDYKRFLEENHKLISFMGVPNVLPEIENSACLPNSVPSLRTSYPVADFLFQVVHQTAVSGKLPASFVFNSNISSETNAGKILLPANLIWGLLASVIFHPVNKDEKIPDKYWFSLADFKMFISELWGRRDLAEKVMKFYLERKGD